MFKRLFAAIVFGVLTISSAQAADRILPLGDSITGETRAWRLPYCDQDRAACDAGTWHFVGLQVEQYPCSNTSCLPNDQLHHAGYSGYTIAAIRDVAGVEASVGQPTRVMVLAGANDIAWWYGTPIPTLAQQYLELVQAIWDGAPNAVIYVHPVLPVSSMLIQTGAGGYVDRATLPPQLNQALIDTLPWGPQLIMTGNTLTTADLRDGVHPTEAGYVKLAADYHKALVGDVTPPPPPPPQDDLPAICDRPIGQRLRLCHPSLVP